MWNGGLTNEIVQQEIGEKLHWANGRAVLREAGQAKETPFAVLRKRLGRLLIAGGQWLQGPISERQASSIPAR